MPILKKKSLVVIQGRPKEGHGSSFDPTVMNRIAHYRGLHDKWGAKTILTELIQKDNYSEDDLPSESTVERYLRQLGVCAPREKHRPLDSASLSKVADCHDCWQMDDKGVEYYGGAGHAGMINIKDVKSHTHIQAFPIALTHTRCHPSISDYQAALRLAFREFGLPKRLQADHGSNFHENKSQSPFPTPLHLWLVGLGVDLEWSRIYRPTDQAKVERTHHTLHNQIQQSLDFKSWEHFKQTVDERRHYLNNFIPCDTLGQPPLLAFPQAKHSSRFFNPLLEHLIFDNKHIKNYLDQKEWFRKIGGSKSLSLGGQYYYIKNSKPLAEVKIVFDKNTSNLSFYDGKELLTQLPLKGIDFQNLVDSNFFNTLNSLQLEIPFYWDIAKINTTF